MILGIDPGAKGAFVTNDDGELDVLDMPTFTTPIRRGKKIINRSQLDEEAVAAWLAERENIIDHAYIEQVSTRPGEGGASAFAFGVNFGLLRGILVGQGIAYSQVSPVLWTKHLGVGADKLVHRQRAAAMFPGQADLFRRGKDDGRADAALITAWALGR